MQLLATTIVVHTLSCECLFFSDHFEADDGTDITALCYFYSVDSCEPLYSAYLSFFFCSRPQVMRTKSTRPGTSPYQPSFCDHFQLLVFCQLATRYVDLQER